MNVRRALQGALDLRPGEGRLALLLYTVMFTSGTGTVWARSLIEAQLLFGEMSIFDGAPRSASAVAEQDVVVRGHPEVALTIIEVLSERLRATNDQFIPRS